MDIAAGCLSEWSVVDGPCAAFPVWVGFADCVYTLKMRIYAAKLVEFAPIDDLREEVTHGTLDTHLVPRSKGGERLLEGANRNPRYEFKLGSRSPATSNNPTVVSRGLFGIQESSLKAALAFLPPL